MLAEDMLQLLTAYVDGELSPRQRQSVLRLLYQSSEAREVLRQLQENRHKVQKLPRRKLDPTFPADVVAAIAERPVIPMKPAPRPAPTLVRWVPIVMAGVAAAVMFAVALGGVLYFALDFGPEPQAKVNPPEKKVAKKTPDPVVADNGAAKKEIRKPLNPMIARMMGEVARQYATDLPPERPAGYAFRDITNGPVATEVAGEINKNSALELQVSVRNNPQALDRLRHVLRTHDIDLVIDPATDAALKNTQGKTELFVYADSLKQGELEKILKELAQQDKQAANPFETLTVAALSADDSRQVNERLGNKLNVRDDPGSRQGIQQPNPKVRGKTPTRVVAVLPPGPQSTTSDTMRRFLFQRADPGAVKVLVRIRQE